MNSDLDQKIYWCAGFFDGEGSFSFSDGAAKIVIVNTNPIAVSYFHEVMEKNGVDFRISERSKPSKSSKKKRWDLYISSDEALKFINLMKNKIQGKQKQLFLMEEYLINKKEKTPFYDKIMKYTNQTCYMFIKDDEKLWQKLGFIPDIVDHKRVDIDDHFVNIDDFNNLDYLCGVIDAEGSTTISHINNKHTKNIDRYTPIISFTNTNKRIVEKCCSILKNNNVGYYVFFRVSEERNRGRWDVTMSGVKRCLKLSNLIKDKLIIKRQQAELLNNYCKMRLEDKMSMKNIGLSYKEAIEALNKTN